MSNSTRKTIPPLIVTGNLLENWKIFKNDFLNYIKAAENRDESSETHVAILLNLIGENGLKIFNSLTLSETDVEDIITVLRTFESKCTSKELNSQRSEFYTRIQKDNETFDEFHESLNELAKPCFFGNKIDFEIKYRIYLGLKDEEIKEKLTKIDDMTLEDMIQLCKNAELYKSQNKIYPADGQVILQKVTDQQYTKSTECVLQSSTNVSDVEEAIPKENLCGLTGWHPKWLQKYTNTKIFLIVYGLSGTIQAMAFMYFVVTLTTLEKRFKIPSQTTGIIISGNEISQILLSLILSYAGGQRNRPRWIAWGIVFCSLSCFILILPHLLYGPGEDILQLTEEYIYRNEFSGSMNSTKVKIKDANKLCSSGSDVEECDELFSIVPLVLIFLSQFVLGIGNTLYYSLGQSYLDDNTKKTNTPMLLAYAMSLRMFGPVMGFVLGYFSLNIFIDPSKTPLINNKDPRWLGAWWIGWLIIGFGVLLFALLMGMFPKEMPKKKVKPDLSEVPRMLLAEDRYQSPNGVNQIESSEGAKNVDMKNFMPALLRLLKNKLLMFNILAAIFYILGSSAYITFMNKYMEVIYNKSSADAAVVIGPLAILGLVFGFLSSGYFISKYKPSLRALFLWNVFVGIVVMCGQIAYMFLTCDNGSIFTSAGMLNITNSCNSRCSCDNVPYSPVCHEATMSTYFSPCHAGCDTYNDKEKKYTNCHCTDETTIAQWMSSTTPISISSTTDDQTSLSFMSSTQSTTQPSNASPFKSVSFIETTSKNYNTIWDTTTDVTDTSETTKVEVVFKSNFTDSKNTTAQYAIDDNTPDQKESVRQKRYAKTDPKHDEDKSSVDDFLVPGVCLAGCATVFYIANGMTLVINTLSGTARISNILLNFRVVSKEDKSLAQGLTLMFISLFALIPGPIIFGYIIDSTCLIWNHKCEDRGNCQLYDQTKFRYYINLGAVLLTSVGVFFDVLIWIYGKGVDLYGEEETKRKQELERRNQHISPLLSKPT